MNLRELQHVIQDAILKDDQSAKKYINLGSQLSEQQGLSIYRNGYYARLCDILKADYDGLYQIMGDAAFAAMVHDYLDAYPSTDYSVRSVGKRLVAFLTQQPNCHPAFIELARFEWAMTEALYAQDVPVLTVDDLAQIHPDQWDTLVLRLHPAVTLLNCQYNGVSLWQAATEGQDLPDIQTYAVPEVVLIWRCHHEVFYSVTSAEQGALLTLIAEGKDFLELFDATYVAESLRYWVDQELFVAC